MIPQITVSLRLLRTAIAAIESLRIVVLVSTLCKHDSDESDEPKLRAVK